MTVLDILGSHVLEPGYDLHGHVILNIVLHHTYLFNIIRNCLHAVKEGQQTFLGQLIIVQLDGADLCLAEISQDVCHCNGALVRNEVVGELYVLDSAQLLQSIEDDLGAIISDPTLAQVY